MDKENKYLEHKKNTLLYLTKRYNSSYVKEYQIPIVEDNFSIDETFCTSQRCSKCGGKCCYRFPCFFSPHDFLDITNLSYMREILNTGIVCICKSLNGIYLIRPRGDLDKKIVGTQMGDYYNTCLLLSDNGCLLPSTYRPSEGLLYYPSPLGHLIGYSDKDIERDYIEYQDILKTLNKEYTDLTFPTSKEYVEEHIQEFTRKLIQ